MSLFRRRYTEQGAPPGAVIVGPGAGESVLSQIAFSTDHLGEHGGASAADLPSELDSGRVTWIDVRGLGDGSVVHALGERFGLHRLAISDIINVGQRPKVEHYENFLFVVLRMVHINALGELHWEQVSVVLGANYVLTFQETVEDSLAALRERIQAGRKVMRSSGADYLACAIIDTIVDGYFPVLEHFGDRLENFEELILEDKERGVLAELYTAKRDLAGFRRAIWPLREALSQLLRIEESRLTDSSKLYMRDTLDHTMQVVEVNESYRELAASLVDVHLSMVGQRTNDVMRVLTVISAIFIPLTFVAGIYGMNFDTDQPLNLPELRWPLGYVYFWSVCLVLGTTLLLLFRKLGWLRR